MRTSTLVLLVTVAGLMADAVPPPPSPSPEVVILLHGLARSARSMRPMQKALEEAGYRVYNLDYPSTEKNVQQLTEEHLAPLITRCQFANPAKIHFVAHSLGNIVLRQYFMTHELHNAGRLVMLGPPNQGSEVVDKLGDFSLYDWINGPAGQQLGTGTNALPATLPPPPLDTGVIAGRRSINWILSSLIPGPDDGKVAITHTHIKGMDDFIIVPVSHPFLMRDREVIGLTLHFLRHGKFKNLE
jgi:pimeloyl-ACP methyl ester carboxylesterase